MGHMAHARGPHELERLVGLEAVDEPVHVGGLEYLLSLAPDEQDRADDGGQLVWVGQGGQNGVEVRSAV